MEFRQARGDDLEVVLKARIELVSLLGPIPDMPAFCESSRRYLLKHLGGHDLIVALAIDNGLLAACAMAYIYDGPPSRSNCDKNARLVNVFTRPQYRRRGLATQLIRLIEEELPRRGVKTLLLEYTDEGLPLYQRLGFEPLTRQMQLKLS